MNINSHYKEAIDWLDEQYAFFLTHVLGLGRPEWTNAIPTAAVALPSKKADPADFSFIFNPDFAEGLAVEELGFVLAHETMHILLNHLKLAKSFKNEKAFNIAADCVINDYLAAAGIEVLDGAMRGQEIVQHDCANCTVTEVYDEIKHMIDQAQAGGNGEPEYRELDNHDWIHGRGTESGASEKLDDLYEQVKEEMPGNIDDMRQETDFDSGMKMAGSNAGREQAFQAVHGVNLAWTELLKELNPDMFRGRGFGPPPRPSYHKPRRKLGAFYPDVMLPVYRPGIHKKGLSDQKPAIVMALDTSGSIGPKDAQRFISLAQSIPQDKIHLYACTFTTVYKELDLDNPRFASGGTSFGAIQQFIHDKVIHQNGGKYPSAVVVITDGEATFGYGGETGPPTPEQAKGWYWLISGGYGYTSVYKQYGRNKPLTEFAK
jgi:predicted metal-dependent peptidase